MFRNRVQRTPGTTISAAARGVALFFGAFSLANAVVAIRTGRAEDLWWVDASGLPTVFTVAIWLSAGLLVAYGLAPVMRSWRRHATAAVSVLLTALALVNAGSFYSAWRAGTIDPAVAVPFSVPVALGFAFIALQVWRARPAEAPGRAEAVGTAIVTLLAVVAFPLAHVCFFGTTDYRREADVAVVFGARVFADGRLTVSLEDRVRTAAGLYNDGLVTTIVMSGGVGESGYDETVAMRDRAMELGVPAEAIVLDHDGLDTDHTVANTLPILAAQGSSRVLAVSQFYHLPRIKMAYRAVGYNVLTVPAEPSRPIRKTPLLVAREIPGFWVYWARAWMRDVSGS